ncbi:MAG: T9SS type A sorting domain-containing protein [Bacteroidota bacterium]|nr:T9SS type A sorting domain-containing protein [Bacteroidota bacterium]
MNLTLRIAAFLLLSNPCLSQINTLKSVVYDFDGLDIGSVNLPDGDYRNNDLFYQVSATPFASSEVLGDRTLELNINWSVGNGEFGKGISRFIDLNAGSDYINFYLYNALSNGPDSLLEIVITEDDNSNNIYEIGADDKWSRTISYVRSAGWQLISIPLNSFTDSNPGGNGIFDCGYSGSGSMLFSLSFIFQRTSLLTFSEQYYMDMICFSEGVLPSGASILDLPQKDPGDHCLLGALSSNELPATTPDTINGLFTEPNLKFVNWFMTYSKTDTVPNQFPGTEVSALNSAGYIPIITWEMMYDSFARLDPVQPRLSEILNGSFDTYIDAFADQIKTYGDTVILRIFHEFEGNWYSWSLTENGSDPATFVSAWKYVVDRFRNRGTNNVKWMWCVNAEPKPYVDYNWIIDSYPGSAYVDIVATDIYNHPDLGIPEWRSFRFTIAESYYYLNKYFPDKPLYICEVGCRERYPGEPIISQSKAEWVCQMSRDLKTYFNNTRALVFFSLLKEHDWRVNSSAATLNAFTSCIWEDDHFIDINTGTENMEQQHALFAYPNPFLDELQLDMSTIPKSSGGYILSLYNMRGQKIHSESGKNLPDQLKCGKQLPPGVYFVELISADQRFQTRIVKIN